MKMDPKVYLLFVFVIIGILTHEIVAQQAEFCQLTATVGACRAGFRRYAYNPASGQCEQFTYGGCGGNANNFKSITECEEACKNTSR